VQEASTNPFPSCTTNKQSPCSTECVAPRRAPRPLSIHHRRRAWARGVQGKSPPRTARTGTGPQTGGQLRLDWGDMATFSFAVSSQFAEKTQNPRLPASCPPKPLQNGALGLSECTNWACLLAGGEAGGGGGAIWWGGERVWLHAGALNRPHLLPRRLASSYRVNHWCMHALDGGEKQRRRKRVHASAGAHALLAPPGPLRPPAAPQAPRRVPVCPSQYARGPGLICLLLLDAVLRCWSKNRKRSAGCAPTLLQMRCLCTEVAGARQRPQALGAQATCTQAAEQTQQHTTVRVSGTHSCCIAPGCRP